MYDNRNKGMNTSVPRLVLKGETTKPECPRHSPQVELEVVGRQPSIDSHGMRFRWEVEEE